MDAVNAYLALAEQSDKGSVRGQAFNFSTGEPTSVSEIVHLILGISGDNSIKPIAKNAVEGEVKKQFLDPTKAKKIDPRHTNLDPKKENLDTSRSTENAGKSILSKKP